MTWELQKFIKDNIDLIDQSTKESWELIYRYFLAFPELKGELTTIMLSADIDPAEILGYIPDCYLFGSNIENYTIPDSVKSIRFHAFKNCSSLTEIVMPDSVTSIGEGAFYGCSSLTEINFKGTKKQAIQLGIGSTWATKWRENSAIEKIICSDGEIILQ